MSKLKILRYISFSILPLTIYSVEYQSNLKLGNEVTWWIFQVVTLLLFWKSKSIFTEYNLTKSVDVIFLYLIWNLICTCRGVFIAETYWDWKYLVANSMTLLLPIVIYAATTKIVVQSILSFYVRYTLPLFLFFATFISTDVYGFYLVPISFLMLFLPLLPKTWKIIVILCSFFVITIDLDARSNVIRFLVPILLLFIYYFRYFINVKLIELVRKLVVFAPLLFFSLAVTSIFNIFNIDNYIKGEYKEVKKDVNGQQIESDLKADTRTFLYFEVLNTAKIYDSWILGRTPARGNISELVGEGDLNKRRERIGNEVAILNIFTWTGIIGVIFYFLIFYKASYKAINQSNNIFSKMIGVYIAFRWLYGWVEDINEFKLNYFFLWLTIGLCFSKSFREMTDKEVKYWVLGIFDKRLRNRLNEQKKTTIHSYTNHRPQPQS